jgi:DNA-directed RNA polymerase subunit K/omega
MEEDPTIEVEARKMTMIALRDLLSGKLKFARIDSI